MRFWAYICERRGIQPRGCLRIYMQEALRHKFCDVRPHSLGFVGEQKPHKLQFQF